MNLDHKDRQLLALLEQDSRLTNAELAEKLGMSTSACWRRVRAFEEAGIITRYGAVLDRGRMGESFHAIIHVQLVRHDPEGVRAFNRAIIQRSEVQECYATAGQADYHIRVRCADITAYNAFLEEVLFRLPAVSSAQTNVILRELKV